MKAIVLALQLSVAPQVRFVFLSFVLFLLKVESRHAAEKGGGGKQLNRHLRAGMTANMLSEDHNHWNLVYVIYNNLQHAEPYSSF